MVVRGEGKSNKDYWAERERELKHIQDEMLTDNQYKKALNDLYRTAQEEIEKDIARDIAGFARRDNLSMAEARKVVSKTDVESYSSRAKKYVEQAKAMRQADPNKVVRFSDFSDKANRELRRYNITMRSNRLELLEAKINLNTVLLANEEEGMLQEHLAERAIKEYTRQAGILGMTVPDQDTLARMAKAVVEAEFRNTIFSERIWENQRELQNELETVIRRTIIRGENPRVAARQITGAVDDNMGTAKYKAERIAITESSRVQSEIQHKSFEEFGITQFELVAEPSACDICKKVADNGPYLVSEMEAGTNAAPLHPFCKCSVVSYVDRDAWDADLRSRGL